MLNTNIIRHTKCFENKVSFGVGWNFLGVTVDRGRGDGAGIFGETKFAFENWNDGKAYSIIQLGMLLDSDNITLFNNPGCKFL